MQSLDTASSAQVEPSNPLRFVISEAIKSVGGWIGFDEFMRLALYEPGLGYYAGSTAKFGEQGDFITAPLISPMFSRCIARQCQQILLACENKNKLSVVEFGAGSGQMMIDILRYFEAEKVCFDEYIIVETSPDLIERQRAALVVSKIEIVHKVRWARDFDEPVYGVIIANELLDALPVKRFQIDESGKPRELGVVNSDHGFEWSVSNSHLVEPIADRIDQLNLATDYRSEIGLQSEAWLKTISGKLDQGGILLIDYGFPSEEYYHSDRREGTLMCHYQHTAHDNPFLHIGEQDITSHVDFSAIAAAGLEAGLELKGFTCQADFLLSLDILEDYESLMDFESDTQGALEMAQQIKKLTMPHEMGELFKAMFFSRNLVCDPIGFKRRNQLAKVLA